MIFDALKELGFEIDAETKKYYQQIQLWDELWRGYSKKYHDYNVTLVDRTVSKRSRKTLCMAKKVSEDWASMLLNEKTFINVDDDESQKFLSGDSEEQNGGVLGLSKFWKQGNRTIEKAYACGTSCFYLDVTNPTYNQSTDKLSAENVRIKYIKDAQKIVPLVIEDDEILGIALCSTKIRDGKRYAYLQTFLPESDHYRISNYFYFILDSGKYQRVPNLDGIVNSYTLPCKPFFIARPNVENNVADVALGTSIYANCIDQLVGCDIAYDNLMNDIETGKKKVFIDQDCIVTETVIVKENGEVVEKRVPVVSDTLEQSIYIAMPGGDTDSEKGKRYFEEYTPDLRVEDNVKNIELQLSLLSQGCRMGPNRYRFDKQTMNTATEVKASNSELIDSVNKERIAIQELLVEMTRSILILGKELCGSKVNPDAKISIKFDDTMFNDLDAERLRDLQEVAQGVMPKFRYAMKWYGLDEEEARQWVKDANEETSVNSEVENIYA